MSLGFFPKIKHAKELKRDLTAELVITPRGEKIFSCLQCGTCGSAWLGSMYIHYTPRRLIGMALGLHKLFVPLTWDVGEKGVAAREPAAA